jgi:class 3 adenylate cyclase
MPNWLVTVFFADCKAATQLLKEADVHVVTGLLKLYFRELPEALFTDALYPNLVTGMGTSL